jgi:hypothetical protein
MNLSSNLQDLLHAIRSYYTVPKTNEDQHGNPEPMKLQFWQETNEKD